MRLVWLNERKHMPESRRYYHALAGVKGICLLVILVWHCGFLTRPDWGARCCEAFFVISGFLEGAGHRFDWAYTLDESIHFWWRKFKAVWPLFAVVYVVSFAWSCLEGSIRLGGSSLMTSVFFLTLMHAWIPSIALTPELSGASWFISALLFCYLMTPLVAWVVRTLGKRFAAVDRGCLISVVAFFGVRVFLDVATRFISVPYSVHCTPYVRLLEYAGAYSVGCWYVERRGQGANKSVAATAKESAVLVCYLCASLAGNDVIWRSVYVLLAVPVVVVLADEGGAISRALSAQPLAAFSRYEMRFYLLHQLGIRIASVAPVLAVIDPLPATNAIRVTLAFLVTMALAMAWTALGKVVASPARNQ